LFLYPDLTLFSFLCSWKNSEGYKRKLDTRDELLLRVLDAAARIKKHDDQPRRTIRDIPTRVAKFIEVDGENFENLFTNLNKFYRFCVKNLSFKHLIKIKINGQKFLLLYYNM